MFQNTEDKVKQPPGLNQPRHSNRSLVRSIIVFLAGLLFTGFLWNMVSEQQFPTMQTRMEQLGNTLELRIEHFLESRLEQYQAYAQIFGYLPATAADEAQLASSEMWTRFPESRWLQFWPKDAKLAPGQSYSSNDFSVPPALEQLIQTQAPKQREVILSGNERLILRVPGTGEQLYLICFPIEPAAYLEGNLWIVVDIKDLLRRFFSEDKQNLYHYVITSHWETLATDLGYHEDVTVHRPFKITRVLDWGGLTLWLNAWPKPYVVNDQLFGITNNLAGTIILIMGFFFSILMALLAWTILTRTHRLKVAVDRQTAELKEKNKALEIKNDEIENFIYTISHDLKSPLVSIQGFASILKEEFGKQLAEAARSYLDRIVANTTKMHRLIQDLLELSRIGRVEDTVEKVDADQLVHDILAEHHVEIESKHIHVSVKSKLPVIEYPRIRLHQVFDNLISNAIKYSDPKKRPEITVDANGSTDSGGPYHHFLIQDNGLGIKKEYQDKIFQIFQRVHTEIGVEGTGVGLSIVKKIVEKEGGTIHVISEAGTGSTFEFTVPKEKAA